MTTYEALDTIFSFIPEKVLNTFKKKGLYDPILSGQVNSSADFYTRLKGAQAVWQNSDYRFLSKKLRPHLCPGSILEIACGQGDLMEHLAQAKFRPIYGLDHSRAMIHLARKRLKNYRQVYLISEKVENFDFRKLAGINNVIINNFWGLIDKRSSIKLLLDIKLHLKGQLIIGPFYDQTPEPIRLAAECLERNLHFNYSYPLFTKFKQLGYREKEVEIAGAKYYVLSSNL